MKEYPSMPKVLNEYLGKHCIAFKKEDGSQIRVKWAKTKGWRLFATRGRVFSASDKDFGCAIDIFNQIHAEKLTQVITENFPKVTEAIAFLEFLGPHSFAGLHDPGILKVENNDPKKLILFDINIHRRGILGPELFCKYFKENSAEVVYEGKLTEEFIKNVRESKYNTGEGVVAKGGDGHNVWMCKIKTWDYLKKIQKFFGSSYGNYWE